MATFQHGPTTLHYDLHGNPDGFPVLLIAPGGMRSAAEVWSRISFDPRSELAAFRLIAMDQRNAGRSFGPIEPDHGWATYTADQLALLDHLGIDRFAVVGMCIGGPYIMGLIGARPERVVAAVMFQPIGLDANRDAFFTMFDGWQQAVGADHPEADGERWRAFRDAMFGGDFLFGPTTREEAAACRTPILLFMGDDLYHPQSVSRELAGLLPNVRFIERWKEGPDHDEALAAMHGFLADHTPPGR